MAASEKVAPSKLNGQGGSSDRAHFKTSRCPPSAASEQVSSFQGHGGVCALHHFKTSRCPPAAASAQVLQFQGQGGSWALAHFKTSRCPSLAAFSQVSSSHGQPPALANRKTSILLCSAASEQTNLCQGSSRASVAQLNTPRSPASAALVSKSMFRGPPSSHTYSIMCLCLYRAAQAAV